MSRKDHAVPMQPLQLQPTSFVGRTKELDHLAGLLADPNCRLISIIGPGGIGKTRLVLQVAAEQTAQFRNGVYFVPLQGINSTELLPSVMASALNTTLSSGEDARVQIINFLREKHLLLVLDNFEHLLNGADLISTVLTAAASVKILVTSRERLNVQEEWTLTLQGLAFPDKQNTEALEQYSAVELFVQRARQVQVEFALQANAEAVKQICQQVEGMPLAIELAATWLRVMTCQQIAAQMGRGLDFLTSPLRNVPERHRSLRAVFEQSWTLLPVNEQDVLKRLSVFRGGFDLEAAAEVAGATLIALAGLVDKSLIRVNAVGRYDMHELLRQFAQDKLTEAGEMIVTMQRHLAYFVQLAETGELRAYGREQIAWYDRQEAEMDNLRAAMAWSLSNEEIESGLRIAAALRWVWEMRGPMREGFDWMVKLLPLSAGVSPLVYIKGLHRASEIATQLYVQSRANAWSEQALILARAMHDQWSLAWALSARAFTVYEENWDQAAAELRESIALFRALNDPFGLSHALRRQTYVATALGDYAYAQALIEEALTRDREVGDKNAMAWEFQLLSDILWRRDQHHDVDRMLALLQESLLLFQELRDVGGIVRNLQILAAVDRARQNYAQSAASHKAALLHLTGIGLPEGKASLVAVAGLGGMAVAMGDLTRGVRLLGAADSQLIKSGSSGATAYASEIAYARTQLGDTAFNSLWAEGETMAWQEVIAYALQADATVEASPISTGSAQILVEPLSARELDVLRLMAEGMANPQIAAQLVVATGTIKAHTNSIFGKLGVNNRVQAVNRARELRLLENKPSK